MNFFTQLLEWIKEMWPLRKVEPWERGFYLIWSQVRRKVGPGIWPVVPYFMDVASLSVAVARAKTPLLTIKLLSGKQLCFSASARVRVVDPELAIVNVQDYQETAGEELEAKLAEALSEAPMDRFDTIQRRRNFITKARAELNETLAEYGIEVIEIQFTNWIEDERIIRLLQDSALQPPSLTW